MMFIKLWPPKNKLNKDSITAGFVWISDNPENDRFTTGVEFNIPLTTFVAAMFHNSVKPEDFV